MVDIANTVARVRRHGFTGLAPAIIRKLKPRREKTKAGSESESVQPPDTAALIDEYRGDIATGGTVPYPKIIALYTQLLQEGSNIPLDLEEHSLVQIFADPSVRTAEMARRLADVMTMRDKPLPDDLRRYLNPTSTAAPALAASSAASSSVSAPEDQAPAKPPREASVTDNVAALEVAYARGHGWTEQGVKALETMPFLAKPLVYSASAGQLGKVWADALRCYFDDTRLAAAQSALSAIESGDAAALADTETFARAMVAAGRNRRIPFDLMVQALRCAEVPGDGGRWGQAKDLCFRRLIHWHDVGALFAMISRRRYGSPNFAAGDAAIEKHADEMRTAGTTTFAPLLSDRQIEEVYAYFLRRPTFSGHTAENRRDNIQRYVGYGAEAFSYGSYSLADAVEAPHLLELSVNPTLLEVGRRHLGATPLLSKIYALWDFPNTSHLVPSGVTIGDFHRDLNDFGMFWVYMYLSDVDMDCGPHALIPHSHRFDYVSRRFDEAVAAGAEFPYLDRTLTPFDLFDGYGYQIAPETKFTLFGDDQKFFVGRPGTIFASNGLQIHKIHQPQRKRRLIVAFRYQVTMWPRSSPMRESDIVPEFIVEGRVPDNPAARTVLDTMIRWDGR